MQNLPKPVFGAAPKAGAGAGAPNKPPPTGAAAGCPPKADPPPIGYQNTQIRFHAIERCHNRQTRRKRTKQCR